FASEDEIEVDPNLSAPTATTLPTTTANNPTMTLTDLSQGITRANPLWSTLTIGELQKLLQRPKEIRLIYDFNNLTRTNTNDSSSTSFLHYVIQIANQCLTSIAERQSQTEMKTAKKQTAKKQQSLRSKCYCSCCSSHHQHPFTMKDQKRTLTKTANSPNAEICALLQMPQTIPMQDFSNEDILTVQTSLSNNTNSISDGDLHNKQSSLSQCDEQVDIFDNLSWPPNTVAMPMEQSQVSSIPPPPPSLPPQTQPITTSTNTTTELPPLLTLLLPMMNGVEPTPPPSSESSISEALFAINNTTNLLLQN
ncbi:unnamed protein product, partial [Rotaria magnacalcarata]